MPRINWRRTRVFIVLLLMLWGSLGLAGGPDAKAETDHFTLQGEDRYESAIQISKAGFGPGVDCVVIANGEDAMTITSSAVLAAAYEGPLLLTPAEKLDPRVRDELWRLGPDRIFVVGTSASVAVGVAGTSPELGAAGRVLMLSAADGAATAVLVAEHLERMGSARDGVVLMSRDYALTSPGVAVCASTLAGAKGWPLMFVPESGSLDGEEAEVVARFAPTTVIAVQTAIEVDTDVEITRLWGRSEYEVGARIAEYGATVGLSYSHLATIVPSGQASDHCLTVGAYLARTAGTAILVAAEWVPKETALLLVESVSGTMRVDVCGPLSGSTDRVLALLDMTGGLPSGFPSSKLRRGSKGENVAWLEQRLSELSYRPGLVDGVFDWRTKRAVIAFQKWEGLNRDGLVGEDEWWALVTARPPKPQHIEQGISLEVDKAKQVLLYCVDGVVERTLPVSTGNPRVGMVTPSGTYHIARENTRERLRYKPLYLREWGYLAIHGYTSVPSYPASHGCIRTTWTDMDELHALVPIGTVVHIY